jgi:hypothetical protein
VQVKSYASVLNVNNSSERGELEKVVKSAVMEGVKAQKLDEKINSTIVIFGVPDTKNDVKRVYELLQCDDNDDYVIKISRIGKVGSEETTNATKRTRPIRVELKCRKDRDWVLENSKFLVRAFGDLKVRIAKYLDSNELLKLKATRNECTRLNSECNKLKDGRSKFFVIDGHICERLENGKIIRFVPPMSGNNSAEPKNGY